MSVIFNLGIEAIYSFKFIGIGAFAGYSFDTLGDLRSDGSLVSNADGNRFYADWAGYRFGVRLNIALKDPNKPPPKRYKDLQ